MTSSGQFVPSPGLAVDYRENHSSYFAQTAIKRLVKPHLLPESTPRYACFFSTPFNPPLILFETQ